MSSTSAAERRREAPARSRDEPLDLLIVDDDLLSARLLKANLDRPGRTRVNLAGSGEEALERIAHARVDVVLTDLSMPEMDGIELLRRIRGSDPSLPVIIMTANATLEKAVEGIRGGATDFLQKPVNVTAVQALAERAVADRPLREEIVAAQERRARVSAGNLVFGDHPRLDAVRDFAVQVAGAPNARVLLTGESGTGKSLVARLIHDLSAAGGRFVGVNCAALPPHLLESELFGHEKGAFTDAKTLKRGLIETADKGTLFLDEIGTLPIELQAKLLLFLENREIRRVGGTQPLPVSTRVVTATNDDLRKRVREGEFRQDLLYRLDVAAMQMPPLREMPAVIPQLAELFAGELASELRRPRPTLSPECLPALREYPWPGNARELRNAVERALIFHQEGPLKVLPPAEPMEELPPGPGMHVELGLSLEEVERRYLVNTLEATDEDLATTAARLGISRKTLWEKRKRYDL